MRICLFTHTLNPKTGIGVFTRGIVDGVKTLRPDIEFSSLTSEDYLKLSLFSMFKNWSHIRQEIKNTDLIHAIDGYPYGVVAYLANLGISKPLLITAVGTGSVSMLKGFGWQPILVRRTYTKASSVTAISNYIAKEVKKILPKLSLEVINPCVDYSFYSQSSNNNLNKNQYIVTQGEFKKRKGYEKILPIMKELMTKYPRLRYTIVGNTNINKNYFNELVKLMEKLEIRNRVDVKSNLTNEELRETYRNARLYFTLPINYHGDVEGFGMAIVEAAATGTPAVVGRGSGADDTVKHSESGFLVDNENTKEIMERIFSIIEDDKLHEKLSLGAKNFAKGNSPENKAREYVKIYEKA